MITTTKLAKGYYSLNWNGSETGYTILKRDNWVLTDFEGDTVYSSTTKADVLDHARNLIDYS